MICGKGRGGNNIAENVKKSLISIIRKLLSPSINLLLQQECIDRHNLKSQKETILVIFLYLHKFVSQTLISVEKIH